MKTKILTICLLLVTSQVFANEYTLYDCKVDGNEKKSYENYMACDRNCKKTNRKLKIRVNQNNNSILLIYKKNTKELFREYLENKKGIFHSRDFWSSDIELKIFDEDNWRLGYQNMTGGVMDIREKSVSDGKIFRDIFLTESWNLKKYICGK